MAPKPKRNATTFSRLPDFEEVALDLIQPNSSQPRTNLSEPQAQAKLASLAQSIEQYGLQQPILIRRMEKPAPSGEVYEIVAGERRYLAHKVLGKESIPALTLDEDACGNADLISLIENIQRENLDAVDLAHAIQRMIARSDADDGPRMTLEDVGKVLGMTKGSVSRVLGVLKLDELDPKYLQDYRSGTFRGDDGEERQVSEVVTGTALSEFSFVARDQKNPLPAEVIDELWGRIRIGALPKNAIRTAAKEREATATEPKPKPDATERSFTSLTKALDGFRSVGTLTDEAKERLRALRDELDAILGAA